MKKTAQKGKQTEQIPTPTTASKQTNSLKKYYYLFGLLTFFLFANTIGNDYNMDDGLVTRNHKLTSQGLSAIGDIFTSPYYSDAMGYAYGYRPMVHLSFALEYELFGEKPGAGHFINVILFALCVVLFFKLLIKWVGEQNALFAGIATLIFAVHPIHTEVVDSLKNRDEILAFLFVIWAGLSAHKFLEKGKWLSLISIFILFSLAMLSKKSIYPLAIVFPAAMVLLKELTIKQLIFITLSFILPAALIGADFQLERGIVMLAIPIVVITLIYFIKFYFLTGDTTINLKTVLNNWIIPTFLTIIVVTVSIYTGMFWLLYFTIPFLIWLFKVDFQVGIYTLLLLLVSVDFQFGKEKLPLLILLIGIGYALFLQSKGASIKKWGILAVASLVYFLVKNHLLFDCLFAINAILFFLLIYKKVSWGAIFSILTATAVIIVLGEPNFYAILTVSFAVLLLLERWIKSFPWSSIAPILAFLGLLIFLNGKDNQFNNNHTTQVALKKEQSTQNNNSQLPKASDSFLKEGRTLLYAENTLVAPHTQEETIATGFATLGEYLQLHIFPKELSFYYGYAKIKTVDFKQPIVWFSIIAHLLLIFIAIWQLKRRPLIAIGVMWYVFGILLFSNWVELVAGMVGERLAFTASAGFCILLTSLLYWIKPDFSIQKPGIIGAVFGIVILFFAGRTIVRNADWKDTVTLMGHDIKHLSKSAQANNLYAMTLMAHSIKDKTLSAAQKLEIQRTAISHFDQATVIWPEFFNAYIDKGRAARITQDYPQAIEAFKKSIEIDPSFVDSYYNLLEIYEQMGEKDIYLKTAEELFNISKNQYSYAMYARAYFIRNDFKKSHEILSEGLKAYPGDELLSKNLKVVEQMP